jgi:chromosome segregation ATPase
VRISEIKAIASPWISKLENYVKLCDKRFSAYMAELNCSGEVHLYKPKEDGDYADWGIHLMVKYREAEKLSILSAQVHSGGERSVATIMFLMALQDQVRVVGRGGGRGGGSMMTYKTA